MKVVYNKIIPFPGYKAINLFGILFVRKGATIKDVDLIHEYIHTEQMKEMLFIFFYLWYAIEWLFRYIGCFDAHRAYRSIGFEKEAYQHQSDNSYLTNRKHYTWLSLI